MAYKKGSNIKMVKVTKGLNEVNFSTYKQLTCNQLGQTEEGT